MDIICNETSFLVLQTSFLMFSVFCFGFIDNSCLKQKNLDRVGRLKSWSPRLLPYNSQIKDKIFCTIAAHLKYQMILLYQKLVKLCTFWRCKLASTLRPFFSKETFIDIQQILTLFLCTILTS